MAMFNDKIKEYEAKVKETEPSPEAVKKQHDKGKLTARERIKLLVDSNSFNEIDALVKLRSHNFNLQDKKKAGDAVVTGYATVNKRPVYLYAQDFTAIGGSLGEMHADKIVKIMKEAVKTGTPFVAINDSGGARIQEGVNSLDGYGKIFKANTFASGVIPQISVILGPCAGGAVYSPAITDFVFMVNKLSHMFITGPDVIKSVTGEEISFEDLGGASVHNKKSGNAHFLCKDEKQCFEKIKQLLSYLPQNNMESPPVKTTGDSINRKNTKLKEIVPAESKQSYDIKQVIDEIADKNTFFEVHEHFAQSAVVGFARLVGNVVGIVANQPLVLAGVLDIHSSDKIARFVRFCDSFNIPLITLVDVPGYLPGVEQEHGGIIRHGAKMLYAFAEATVPKIALVIRKAYGGAYIAMCSRALAYDKLIAWPTAEIAVMGPEQAAKIIYRRDIKASTDPAKTEAEKVSEFKDKFLNPYVAAEEGRVDMVINPEDSRLTLIKCLQMLLTKREKRMPKKHGNIPL